MPIFRIDILFANGERFKEHHLNDGIDLDTYYKKVYRLAQKKSVAIISFDVVQVSEFSKTATTMREQNIVRMRNKNPNVQPMHRARNNRRPL